MLLIGMLRDAKEHRDITTIRQLFDRRRKDIRSEVGRLQQIKVILENEEASLELIYISVTEPGIKKVASQRIVGKKGTRPYSETIFRLMPALCSQIFSEEAHRPVG